jgi:hypothetical protein
MGTPRPLPSGLTDRAFAVTEAYFEGVTPERLSRADLQAPFHGVRLAAGTELDLHTLCRAYLERAHTRTIFSHTTAARLWRLPIPRRLERDPRIHVLLPGGSRAPRGKGVAGHVSVGKTMPHDVDGLPVASPIATWISLAPLLDLDELIVAGDRLLDWREPLADVDALACAVRALKGRRRVLRLRAALGEMRGRSGSPRETRCRLALVRAGLPEPELNAEILLSNGAVVHGDLVYRDERIVLEYEGDGHRTDDVQWSRDLTRYNTLSEDGWTVIRVSKRMPEADLVRTVRRILSARHL